MYKRQGLTDCYYGMYVFNYFADEDTMVKRYTVSSSTDTVSYTHLDVYKRQIPEGQKDEFEDTMVTSLNDTCKMCIRDRSCTEERKCNTVCTK